MARPEMSDVRVEVGSDESTVFGGLRPQPKLQHPPFLFLTRGNFIETKIALYHSPELPAGAVRFYCQIEVLDNNFLYQTSTSRSFSAKKTKSAPAPASDSAAASFLEIGPPPLLSSH